MSNGNYTNGKTRTCGVIGNPVEHTMSPAIHNGLATMFEHNLVYVPFHVEADLDKAVEGAYALNILGMNVTVPYKSDVMASLKEVDKLAAQIGAVNTLVRMEGGYKGYNTDMPGLYRAMKEDGVELENADVLILGAGGVARAVAVLAADKKAEKIRVLNRTIEKAEAIVEEVKEHYPKADIQAMAISDYEKLEGESWVAIQATSVGMYPKTEDVVISEEGFYKKVRVGYDLIFNPYETKFMKLLKAAGKEAYNGLKMLLYQGIIAYELWNECEVTKEQAAVIYEEMKKQMSA
ncbi:MAG: shikimate dehydrogenase [Lachnospiraceae bacterium]|nr:shikimate dehydrogenase [Lachnospiraceae bacterium]